jgi:hypothetical protein
MGRYLHAQVSILQLYASPRTSPVSNCLRDYTYDNYEHFELRPRNHRLPAGRLRWSIPPRAGSREHRKRANESIRDQARASQICNDDHAAARPPTSVGCCTRAATLCCGRASSRATVVAYSLELPLCKDEHKATQCKLHSSSHLSSADGIIAVARLSTHVRGQWRPDPSAISLPSCRAGFQLVPAPGAPPSGHIIIA